MRLAHHLIEFLVRRSTKEHNVLVRTIATLAGATLFIAGIPALVFWSGKFLDKSSLLHQQVSQMAAIVCFILGLPWVLSAVFWQLVHGKGTPVPIVPTKHFLQNGPYRYVRNPMILGFFLYLLGWAFLFNKVGAFLAAAVLIVLLLIEIKIIEEPELEKRFGDAYREYKKETPFIYPKWRKKNRVRYCQAWVKNTNAQCKNRAIRGSNYCWLHYPKKSLVLESLIIVPLTIILTLIFNDPLIRFLSKVPVLYRFDKKAPLIESLSPDVRKSPNIDKKTDVFNIAFLEKDSGLDYEKSDIKISYKDNQKFVSLKGKVNKTVSKISFLPEKELHYGEYLLEVLLVDKANNKKEFLRPFVVRERDELTTFVRYDTYENASDSDRKIFNSFLDDNKDSFLLEHFKLYIYKLTIGNKDNIAVLKDVYLTIDMSGGTFFCWEQVGNFNAKRADIYGSFAEAFDKRVKGHVYVSQNFLNIEEIGPGGFVTFAILVGQSELPAESKENIWEGIDIYARYLSEGYGSSESRKEHIEISKEHFKPLR